MNNQSNSGIKKFSQIGLKNGEQVANSRMPKPWSGNKKFFMHLVQVVQHANVFVVRNARNIYRLKQERNRF